MGVIIKQTMNYGTQRALISGGSRRWLVLLASLGLSTAFGTINNGILPDWCWEVGHGLHTVFCWCSSFLFPQSQSQSVLIGEKRSILQPMLCGILQSLVLFPLLFNIYIKLQDDSHDYPRPSKSLQHPACFFFSHIVFLAPACVTFLTPPFEEQLPKAEEGEGSGGTTNPTMQRDAGRACVGWRSLGKRVSLKLQDELHGNQAAGHQGLFG